MRSLGWSWIGRRHLRFGRHCRLTGRLAAEDDEPIAEPTTRIAVVLNTWIGRSQAINLLFNEYFHGDNGAGLGAAHQTGWTALLADLILDPPSTGLTLRRGGVVA